MSKCISKIKEWRMKVEGEFKKAIDTIGDIGLRKLVLKFFEEEVLEDFNEWPASSTGKYHPYYSNGKHGLVRHTLAAMEFATQNMMGGVPANRLSNARKDEIRAAILLHDAYKFGEPVDYRRKQASGKIYTERNHGIIAASRFYEFAKGSGLPASKYKKRIENICCGIAKHMGIYEEVNEQFMPKNQNQIDLVYVTASADYMVSRKEHRSVLAEKMFEETKEEKKSD